MVVKQHMVAGRVVFREINAPLEHIGVYGAGCTLMLTGDYLHPVASAESVVETHALEGIGLADASARNGCQSVPHGVPQTLANLTRPEKRNRTMRHDFLS